MMGDPVTKENLEKLPTVIESHEEKLSPKNPNLLTPPSESSPMHKVSSATSIKLMGVPVKDNDPLGALSNSSSPTSMQKSATACELQGNNHKRPSLQENIL